MMALAAKNLGLYQIEKDKGLWWATDLDWRAASAGGAARYNQEGFSDWPSNNSVLVHVG